MILVDGIGRLHGEVVQGVVKFRVGPKPGNSQGREPNGRGKTLRVLDEGLEAPTRFLDDGWVAELPEPVEERLAQDSDVVGLAGFRVPANARE